MSSLDHIVFANRNNAYGAFFLRRKYSGILALSVVICSTLFTLVFFILFLYYGVPEVVHEETWIEYDNSAISNPFQTEIHLKQLPEGAKENQANGQMIVAEEDDFILTSDQNSSGIDTAGNGESNGYGSGNVELPRDTSNIVDFKISDDPLLVYDITSRINELPQFPGGEKARLLFIQKNIKYPKFAINNKIQGPVYVTFIVEPDGSLTNFGILMGIGFGCDEEAIRISRLMPRWIPGKKNDITIRVQITMPLIFTASGE